MPFLLAVCLWAQLFIQLHKCLLCGLPWPVQRHALCSFSCSGKAPANNTTGHITQPAGRAARSVAPSPGLSVAFPVTIHFLTWHRLFRALFGGYSWDHVSHLACSDLSEVWVFRAEGLPPQPCVLHRSPRLCLALCRVCAEQEEDVQHSQYILRGLTVSSCLCRWKQLYLNTACKLVFQNKGIIKARGRERDYQIFMHFKENTINVGVLWLQSVGEQKVLEQFCELLHVQVPLWELGQATKCSDGHRNIGEKL